MNYDLLYFQDGGWHKYASLPKEEAIASISHFMRRAVARWPEDGSPKAGKVMWCNDPADKGKLGVVL